MSIKRQLPKINSLMTLTDMKISKKSNVFHKIMADKDIGVNIYENNMRLTFFFNIQKIWTKKLD